MQKTVIKIIIIAIICLAVGFFAGMEYKAYQVRSALQEATKKISDVFTEPTQPIIPASEKSEQEKEDDYVWIKKNIGDTVELATIKFKVIRSEEKQTINVEYGTPKIAKKGTKFVIIDLEITNITKEPFVFFNDDKFIILDNKERLFKEYENSLSIDNNLSGRLLSPDITERGFFVYEIPQDAESYSLVIRKLGTNEIYEVLLK